MSTAVSAETGHSHVFLGGQHESAEKRTWAVIGLCGAMLVLEIVGGWLFGSIALVADGLHMSTHAGAMLLAALAYSAARRYAQDPRFTFGTGKLGDLAGFTSAIILAMVALLIGYEAVTRFFDPVPIRFAEAIPIAVLGLLVNAASAWLLSGAHHHHGHHHHHHGHAHRGAEDAHHHEDEHRIATSVGILLLSVFEKGVPPVFRVRTESGTSPRPGDVDVATVRPDGARQAFRMADRGGFLESIEPIPEPHEFTALVRVAGQEQAVRFEEAHHHAAEAHGAAHRDNNMRAAVIHVMADAAVSVLVIAGLLLALAFGWLWMDPLAGIVGAFVIASWSWGLIRDTGAILLDMVPDRRVAEDIRRAVEADGDRVTDLHLWRLGPGHLGAILSVSTEAARGPEFYRERLARFGALSHLTVEVSSGRSGTGPTAHTVARA